MATKKYLGAGGISKLHDLMNAEYESKHPYLSLSRKGKYLYEVTFGQLPENTDDNPTVGGGCSSYVQDGKLYRNLDWDYSETAAFHVVCSGFEGMAFTPGLTDAALDDALIAKLPFRVMDGRNDNGISVSAHILYNDWSWTGSGTIPLYNVPYQILTRVQSMQTISTDLAGILGNLYAHQSLVDADYLMQFVITDGTTTYALLPPESSTGGYELVDISDNAKLTNFRWVSDAIVTRADLQNRPTGVERWNIIPTALENLRFTKAYEAPDRLSEFIGIDGTDKDSTDEELEAIYDLAHAAYLDRTRDGETWQTFYSIEYSATGIDMLCVQEDWAKNYADANGDNYVSKAQGSENAGKVLGIGNDGNVTPVTGGGGGGTAADTSYDNSDSGLIADNVQDAIDELNDKIPTGSLASLDEVAESNLASALAGKINGKQDELSFDGTYNPSTNKVATESTVTEAIEEVSGDIPTSLSELSSDATHRIVTDTEKATWNGKSDFSGSYNDLANKPTSLPNPHSLTFGSKSYDGSSAVTLATSDLFDSTTTKYETDFTGSATIAHNLAQDYVIAQFFDADGKKVNLEWTVLTPNSISVTAPDDDAYHAIILAFGTSATAADIPLATIEGINADNVQDGIEENKTNIQEIKSELGGSETSAEYETGNNYMLYAVKSGKRYIISAESALTVTVATVSASNQTIQSVGNLLPTSPSIDFFATSDAPKILFYTRANAKVKVIVPNEISSIKDELQKKSEKQWMNKVWSSYGDSISWLYEWQNSVNSILGFASYVRNGKPGSTVTWSNNTFHIDSNGIYDESGSGETVHDGFCAWDRISKCLKNDTDLIFVMGGTNDCLSGVSIGDTTFNPSSSTDSAWRTENPVGDYDISTFKGAIASTIMKIRYHKPNTLLVFGTLLNGMGATTGVNQYNEWVSSSGTKPSDYAKAMLEVCEEFGVPCIDVFGTCGIGVTNRASYISDTVHPNADGMKLLARCVASGLSKEFMRL